jgi:hypothetical protein
MIQSRQEEEHAMSGLARISTLVLAAAGLTAALPAASQDLTMSAVALSEMAAQEPQVDYEYPEIVVGAIADRKAQKVEQKADRAMKDVPVTYEAPAPASLRVTAPHS